MFNAQAQVPGDSATLRAKIDEWVKTNHQLTGQQLNWLLNGMYKLHTPGSAIKIFGGGHLANTNDSTINADSLSANLRATILLKFNITDTVGKWIYNITKNAGGDSFYIYKNGTHTALKDNATDTRITSGDISNWNGLVSNATHTGDATGSTALTLATVNSNVGTYNGITVNAKGLVTAAASGNYATGGGTATGSNTGDQTNITGNAATVTTNANLTGPVTSTGNATTIAAGAITNTMLANGAVANLSGTNTGDNATNTQYSGLATMTYPGAGIPLSTGSAWGASITNNSGNWNATYSWGNHAGLYPLLTGSYSNPSWINTLAWSKITGTPTTIGAYGITDYNSLGDVRWVLKNSSITGATKTKITFDAKGLVTAGADLSSGDIPDLSGIYQPLIIAGSTGQYYRWDKTFGQIAYSEISGTPSLSGYEVTSNKATSFVTLNNTLYPTTQAVVNYVTAANITGVLAVPKGGIGSSVVTPRSYMQGNDTNPLSERTPDQVKTDIAAADIANYSSIRVETFTEASAGSNGQDNVLINYPAAATSVQVAVNGSVIEPGKYSVVNKTVALIIPVYQYDKVIVTYGYDYSGDAAFASQWYGVERDITSSSADWTRIGYMSLHASLPVQSLLKGVVLNANRTVNYYLNATDWTKKADNSSSVLTGGDGNVMVRKDAATYWKFEQVGNIQRVKCSIYPIPGFTKFDTWNVGAYEASLQASKLSSWKGVLPTTSRSETQFRIDARANGPGYNQIWDEPYKEILWMFVVEYATTNFQKAVNGSLDGNGYHQGGLGDGVTTAVGGEWAAYNGYSPFITCGASDALANGSGQVSATITNFGGSGVNRSFNVPRYRGIENLYGHIWKWTDGISFNHTASASEVWIFDNPDLIADNTSVGARFAGYLPSASGWTTNVLFGPRGDIMPSAVGGSDVTYFGDYFWTPGYGSGWTALLSGAVASDESSAGLFLAGTYYGAGTASTGIGARLFAK